MAICQFFLQGRCRFGERCWNEHPRGGGGRYGPSASHYQGTSRGGGGGGGGGTWGTTNPRYTNVIQPSTFKSNTWGGSRDHGRGFFGSPDFGSSGGSSRNADFSQNRFSALMNNQNVADGYKDEEERLLECVVKDMEIWESSGQWIFSSYSPMKEKPNVSGFLDFSPEELHLEYYNCRANNDIQNYINSVQQLAKQWKNRLLQLKTLNASSKAALPPDNGPPPLPTSSLPEGYYEEAVPLSPGKAPEYITSNYDSDAMSSSYESYDEEEEDGKGKKMRHQWPSEEASMDLVKDAKICAFLLRKKRFGQWTKLLCVIKENKLLCYKSSKDQQPQMELLLNDCSITYIPKDSKKKKHELKISHQGADALVLAVQSKEQAEQWLKVIKDVCSNCTGAVDSDGPLSSSPVHKTELEKKLSSERPSSDGEGAVENGITTACNGKEQVKRKKSSKSEAKGTVTKVTGKKITKIIGLGKKKPSTDEQTSSAEEDVPTCGYLNVLSNNRWRERWCRVKDNKLIFHKDRTDLKTHIVSIPLRGCEVIPGLDSKHPLTFRLLRNGQEVAVLEASSSEDMGRWIGILLAETGSSTDPGALHYDYIDVEMTASVIQTAKQTFCFMNRRVISTNPYRGSTANGYACPSGMALHYDDVPCINGSWEPEDGFPSSRSRNIGEEMLYDNAGLYDNLPSPKIFARYPPADRKPNRLSTDKLSSNHYKYPVSSNLSSAQSVTNTSAVGRGSGSQFKGKKPPATANGISGKGRTLNSQPKKSESVSCVKRTASNAEQYKYGKNRVEADAKRLQSKEEELLKRKEALRNRLAQLRKERKDLRAAIEVNAGRKTQVILEDKLKKLEEECKQKEAERVNLELELTEVKESLKKALAGGITLGLAIEPKSGTSSPQSPIFKHRTLENSPISSCDTSDTECSIPVNSAAALKRPPSTNNSPCRGHVLRKAKEWEMKNGT